MRTWNDVADEIFHQERVYVGELVKAIVTQAGLDIYRFRKLCDRKKVDYRVASQGNYVFAENNSTNAVYREMKNAYNDAVVFLKTAELVRMVLGDNLDDDAIERLYTGKKVSYYELNPEVAKLAKRESAHRHYDMHKRKRK